MPLEGAAPLSTEANEAAPARGAGRGPAYYHDSMILKFTQDGKFLMAIGKPGASKGSNDVENLGLPAKIFVDPKTNEVYVADGYGNKRVIVFDADTGKYKRHWGAYGNKPTTPTSAATSPTLRSLSSSAIQCIAPTSRTTGCSTFATA